MKYCLIIILIVLSFPNLYSQRVLSLEECIAIALEKNNSVQQQKLARQSKEIAYKQSRVETLPNLNGSVSQNFAFGRTQVDYDKYENVNSRNTSFDLSSSMIIFNGLRNKHNIDASRMNLQAADADVEKTKSDITIGVINGYLNVLMNKELLSIAESQLELTKTKVEQQKILVDNGKIAEGELYEILAQEAIEKKKRIQAENSLKLSLLDLAQILEIDDFLNLSVLNSESVEDVDELLNSSEPIFEYAIVNRPEIRAAELRLKVSEKSVSIARSSYYPSLSLSGSIGSRYFYPDGTGRSFEEQLSNNYNSGIGLNLSIPIFNRMSVKNNVRNALIEVEGYKLQVRNAKIQLRKTIEQSYVNALASKSRWEASVKSEKAVTEAYRFTSEKYEAGLSTQYDLFNAKNNLTQILAEQTQAKYEYIFSVKILGILNGTLSYW